jgi:electron transport complex protein RnfG
MAKLESSFKNMVISLFGVTLIASATLGLVNDITKESIADAEVKKQNKAISAVLPQYDHLGEVIKVLPADGKDSIELFQAFDSNNQVIASAVKTYTYNGFNGYIELMLGVDKQGIISGYQVLKHGETPGLGAKMELWFNDNNKPAQNVIGKSLVNGALSVSKDGGSIDAITAATISSRAFLDAINRGYSSVKSIENTDQKQ